MASSIWKTVGDWITGAADAADKYKDIIKIGGSGAKAYLDYKNQKERNELEESAYNDYMTAAADAGQEAQAAVVVLIHMKVIVQVAVMIELLEKFF